MLEYYFYFQTSLSKWLIFNLVYSAFQISTFYLLTRLTNYTSGSTFDVSEIVAYNNTQEVIEPLSLTGIYVRLVFPEDSYTIVNVYHRTNPHRVFISSWDGTSWKTVYVFYDYSKDNFKLYQDDVKYPNSNRYCSFYFKIFNQLIYHHRYNHVLYSTGDHLILWNCNDYKDNHFTNGVAYHAWWTVLFIDNLIHVYEYYTHTILITP